MSVMNIDFGLELRKAYEEGYAEGVKDGMPKWTSVEESLPNRSDDYLVIIRVTNNIRVLSYSARHKVFNAFDSQLEVNLLPIPVTHWMPLPEPPKEESK